MTAAGCVEIYPPSKVRKEWPSPQSESNTVKIARLDKQMLGYFLCSLLISSLSVNFGSKRWRKDGWLTAMLLYGSKSDIARFCLNSHLSSVVYTAPLGQPNCWWPINRHFLLVAATLMRLRIDFELGKEEKTGETRRKTEKI